MKKISSRKPFLLSVRDYCERYEAADRQAKDWAPKGYPEEHAWKRSCADLDGLEGRIQRHHLANKDWDDGEVQKAYELVSRKIKLQLAKATSYDQEAKSHQSAQDQALEARVQKGMQSGKDKRPTQWMRKWNSRTIGEWARLLATVFGLQLGSFLC